MENLVLGSHNEIAGTKGAGALLALGAKQPAMVKVTLYKSHDGILSTIF